MATKVRSYSKINLGLAIGPVRPDGFHGLATLYQTLALHDWVTVEARRTAGAARIVLTSNDARVPVDGRNTAWQMVERALERLGVGAEVAIHIEKALPVQGGMGAGSANAAAALIGLERELGVALPQAERLEVASGVGSDVPLFLLGGAVLGTGRGEVVRGMRDFGAVPCVVAVPGVGVSTPAAFREWDARQGPGFRVQGSGEETGFCAPLRSGRNDTVSMRERKAVGRDHMEVAGRGLTSPPELDRLEELSRVYRSFLGFSELRHDTDAAPHTSGIVGGSGSAKQADVSEMPATGATEDGSRNDLAEDSPASLLALVRTGIENDFEEVVFPQYPLLREIKRELMGVDSGSSALYAALSGSGSALFGLYRSQADAEAAQRRVQTSGCKALLTETLPRSQYWQRMFAE